MDEQRRFASNKKPSEYEENAELLRRETADDMLGRSRSGSAKSNSDPKRGKSSKSSSMSDEPKNKTKSSKSDKTAEAAPPKGKKSSSKSTEPANKIRTKKSVSERLASELVDEKASSVKKRSAKKPVPVEEEPPAEQPDNQQIQDRVSCKTPQVMKLIEDDSDELVIYAGKSRVPKLLRGRESLSRLSRRSAVENETEVVNITELVIKHEAADILDRFNACSCEKCVEVFSEIISQRIPVRYARISRSELGLDILPERAVPMRKAVHSEMIRELICNKKRCFHDK